MENTTDMIAALDEVLCAENAILDPDDAGSLASGIVAQIPLIAAAPYLLVALEEALRILVTPTGLPEKGKGRTDDQQAAFDAARAAIKKATAAT